MNRDPLRDRQQTPLPQTSSSRRRFLGIATLAAADLLIVAAKPAHATPAPSVNGRGVALLQPADEDNAPDPATIAAGAAVVSAVWTSATSIKSLFFDDKNEGLKQRLRVIQAQNAQIIRLLGRVLEILDQLGVIVQQAVREEFRRNGLRHLNTVCAELLDTRMAEADDSSYATAAAEEYRQLLPVLSDRIRQLTQYEDFGYGLYDSVGHAMVMQLWIYKRLAIHPARLRQAGSTFVDYFTAVLDPQREGSVGWQLARTRAQHARLETILTGADKLSADRFSMIVRSKVNIGKNGRTTYYADLKQTLTGSRETGYSHVQEYVNRTQETSERPDHQNDHGHMKSITLPVPDPVDPGDGTPAGRASYFNAVRAAYNEVGLTIPVLAKAADCAALYRDVAQEQSG
jgi:hypothetical protein